MPTLRDLDSFRRLVLPFAGLAPARLASGRTVAIDVRGELTVSLHPVTPLDWRFTVVRFGLSSRGVLEGEDAIGSLGMYRAENAEGRLRLDPAGASATASFTFECEVFYDRLQQERGLVQLSDDLFSAEYERFQARGEVSLRQVEDELAMEGTLRLRLVESLLGSLRKVKVDLSGSQARPQFVTAPQPGALTGSTRVLHLHPIGFKESASDPHSAQTWDEQLSNARPIWRKCCIHLEAREVDPIIDWTRKQQDEISQIALPHEFDHAIRIYMVDADVGGGGQAANHGQPNSYVILSDRNTTNPNLLAHELGHVLRGDHPYSNDPKLWAADDDTVLKPGDPNPDANTLHNCEQAENGGLQPTPQRCLLDPDP